MKLVYCITVLALIASTIAYGEDGQAGPSSSGTATITLVIPPRVDVKVQQPSGKVMVDSNIQLSSKTYIDKNGTKIIIFYPE